MQVTTKSRMKKETMKLFKAILPFLLGFLLIVSFPFVGTNIIRFFYGEVASTHSRVDIEVSAGAHIYDAFAILLGLFVLMMAIVVVLYFMKKSLKLSVRNQIIVSIFLPVLGYCFLFTEIKNNKNLSTGLYLTIFRNDNIHLSRLLSIGANPSGIVQEKNPKGYSPLMIASGSGNIEAVKHLLNAGADKSTKNIEGKTAVDIAKDRGHQEVVALLQD